jgi:hypothetical protein
VTVAEAVIARLAAIAAVTALVPASRIYQLILQQRTTLPAIRVQRIDTIEFAHLRGTAAHFRSRVQVDAVVDASVGIAAAQAIDAAAHGAGDGTALAGWKGAIGSPPFAISAILPLDVRDFYSPDELRQIGVSRDYDVWHAS